MGIGCSSYYAEIKLLERSNNINERTSGEHWRS